MVGILTGALGNLQNKRRINFLGCFGDPLNNLHVVDVEGTDGIASVIGFLEHFRRSNKWHIHTLLC